MNYLFKIGFLNTFLLAIYYLGALFCYLPSDSGMHNKSSMEWACYYYLLGQSFISLTFFILVIIDNPKILVGIPKRKKQKWEEDVILDELEIPASNLLEATEKQDIQFVRGIHFLNIVPNIVLLFLLCLWRDDLLIIVLAIPLAIIQGMIGFLFMFVKADTPSE
jgi:hypothetical protein